MYVYSWLAHGLFSKESDTVVAVCSTTYKTRLECIQTALTVKPVTPVGTVPVLMVSEISYNKSYAERLDTFNNYPKYLLPSKTDLATAGLYYTGVGDITRCSTCDVSISDWRPIHDPMTRHAKANQSCDFVIANASALQRNLDTVP